MLTVRSLAAVVVAAFTMGCASSGQMNADAVGRLEREHAAHPNDAEVARSLGIAYYQVGRFQDARTQLDQAVKLDPQDGAAALYLGLTAEQQHDFPAAKAAYQSYIRVGRTSKVRKQLEARLAALTRIELQADAKDAVAREQQLSTQPPSPNTVAVMPLRFTGSDSTLQPLERGFAELLITDLSRAHELTVVERARIQALLDEMALQTSGQTDSATNVRAGRIIQAARIVNGQILQTSERLRVDAAIVNTQTASVSGGAVSENVLDQLFTIEKAIVLQLFDSLGVRLTTAERNAIEQRPTKSLLALLAYSRGLRLEDQGRYDEAARNYGEAVRIDPGFGAARQKAAAASAAAVGVTITPAAVVKNLAGTAEGHTANKASQGQTNKSSSSNKTTNTVNNINSSSSGTSTGHTSGSTGRTAGTSGSTPPSKNAPATAIGAGSANQSAEVIIVVRLPKP